MRVLIVVLISVVTALTGLADASAQTVSGKAKGETYNGYYLDLSEIAGEEKYASMAAWLRQQLDIADNVGLNEHVLNFFRTIPIIVDEAGCLGATDETSEKEPVLAVACYDQRKPRRSGDKPHNGTFWNPETHEWYNSDPVALAEDRRLGVVLVRPRLLSPERPVLLHEMMHAYHHLIMPRGEKNPGILYFYKKAKDLYPADAYAMRNEREFFAVTASVFLSGKADGGITPADIDKLPGYSNFLRWLFEVNPPKSGTPVASAN